MSRLPQPGACRKVRRDASSFLDGQMTARARGEAQRHLRECIACMQELQQLARLSRAMHNLPPHRIADGMAQRLRRQHDGSRAPVAQRQVAQWPTPRRRVLTRRVVAATLAAALLPLVFWLGYRSGRDTTPLAPIANTTPQPVADVPVLQPRVRPRHSAPMLVVGPAAEAAAEPTGEPAAEAWLVADPPSTTLPAPMRDPQYRALDGLHQLIDRMMAEMRQSIELAPAPSPQLRPEPQPEQPWHR